ncbi:recombinase family protein [Paracoccus sp. TOH]|uniref:recombinase family protein n=1 Tax=Paracoccus sp. TOH TaxID=1263728 RepID=UPI00339D7616
MAGEYSRELSVKVFAGQCRLIELGYRQGGPAGFGLRRALLNERGAVKAELKRGEHKSLQTGRVVLVPGPDDEVRTVRWIYSQFLKQGRSESEIAAELNERGVLTDLGRVWTRATVHQILTNEKYIGNNVYNRRSFKLKRKRVVNGPEMWVRSDGAFEAIVEPKQFQRVQAILAARKRRRSSP